MNSLAERTCFSQVRWPVAQRQVGLFSRNTTVRRYLSNTDRPASGLLFGRTTVGLEDGAWAVPPLLAAVNASMPVLSVGPAGSGLPLHNHGGAWASVRQPSGASAVAYSGLMATGLRAAGVGGA